MVLGLIALVAAACFFGAAFYINFAEHFGRMGLTPDSAIRQWAPTYTRGYIMQASLALLSGVAGVLCWWNTGNANWLGGGILMLANWPWTIMTIMPVNRRLLAISDGINAGQAAEDHEVSTLLVRWSERHAVRSGLSFLAVLCFIYAFTAW